MLDETTIIDLQTAIDEHIAQILGAIGCAQPPVDAVQVANQLGCNVAMDRHQQARGRHVRLAAGASPVIVVRREPRPERIQWSVAHELGESQLGNMLLLAGIDPRDLSSAAREWIANTFAGRLLLPTAWFCRHGAESDWDLSQLKAKFSTASHELIARRRLDTDLSLVVTVVDQGRVTWRRGRNAAAPPILSGERTIWQSVHKSGSPSQAWQRHGRIRVWPIHEPGWRREIICTELAEIDDEPLSREAKELSGCMLQLAAEPTTVALADDSELVEQNLCRIRFANQVFDL